MIFELPEGDAFADAEHDAQHEQRRNPPTNPSARCCPPTGRSRRHHFVDREAVAQPAGEAGPARKPRRKPTRRRQSGAERPRLPFISGAVTRSRRGRHSENTAAPSSRMSALPRRACARLPDVAIGSRFRGWPITTFAPHEPADHALGGLADDGPAMSRMSPRPGGEQGEADQCRKPGRCARRGGRYCLGRPTRTARPSTPCM